MKFHADATSGNAVSAYGDGWVSVNGQRFSHSLVVGHDHLSDWDCRGFDALQQSHFDGLASLDPELVIFGSGKRLQFVAPAFLAGLYARRIGVETMDTQAACRTYNFLLGEGRRVVAALLIDTSG
ncbi:MAG: hypothetical protein EBR18_03320 [Betaproteobacteria bacterium]|nr:hypothetical protein [Betaproteobacteria bacterium]